ncbi:MAG TPA: sulfatase [Thermoanaerobaculia bacterium]|nr:sulfatase [Thermoanaerobaculia bacterium]
MSRRSWRVVLAILIAVTAATMDGQTNVVLISIDTLRADHLGAYGYPVSTTPFIDSLARRGLLFEEVVTPLPSTTPSHASMLTSLYPPRNGCTTLAMPVSRDVEMLAMVFRRNGYYTAASVAVNHLGRAFNFDRGFVDFAQPSTAQRNADAVNADVFRFMDGYAAKTSGRPYFLWVHYFDCHSPYGWWRTQPAGGFLPPDVNVPRGESIHRYDSSIRHVDDEVRRLYAYLSERGLTENTIFCITADHGEQIGDHGLPQGHADIYRETVHVPLIFVGPHIPAGRSKVLVSTLDIAPSLLAAVGLKFAAKVDGQNIIPPDSLLHRFFNGLFSADEETRDFLVTGNPSYTRSIELIHGRYWYIRNFDYLYKVFELDEAKPEGHELPPEHAGADGSATYIIPVRRYSPHVVELSYIPTSRACEAEVDVSLPSRVHYFVLSKKAWGPMVLRIPGARFDIVTIKVTPAACVSQLRWSMTRVEKPSDLSAPGAKEIDSLIRVLYAPRKKSVEDEMYDVERDPEMQRNLINDPRLRQVRETMQREVRQLYTSVAVSPEAARQRELPVSKEDLEKLRSLGYLF